MENLKDKAIDIKGKQYVLVSDRIIYFNEHYPEGSIATELVSFENNTYIIKATVRPDKDSNRIFTGYSQAVRGEGMVNRTAALENAETSAVGRALAMMGIGVIESVASVDEIRKANTTHETDEFDQFMNEESVNVPTNQPVAKNNCISCGSEKVLNPKTGKWFCKEKCWLKK